MLISGHKYKSEGGDVTSCKIWESSDQKLLGVNRDHNLKFSHHILKQCKKKKKTGGKISTLTRNCKFISLERWRVKYFVKSQFAYCLLVWLCCNKTPDNRMNHLHEHNLERFTITMYQHMKNF